MRWLFVIQNSSNDAMPGTRERGIAITEHYRWELPAYAGADLDARVLPELIGAMSWGNVQTMNDREVHLCEGRVDGDYHDAW